MVTPEQLADARRSLGQRLATLREAAGLTQFQLAGLAGYTRSTIANLETGRSGQPRTSWVRYDQLLTAGGALLAGYDQYAALAERQRQQTAHERERQRAAKIEQWRHAHTTTTTPTGPHAGDDHLRSASLDTAEGELIGTELVLPEPPDRMAGQMLDRLELRRQRVLEAVSVGAVTGAGTEEWDRTVLRHGRATRYQPAWQMLVELEADLGDLQRALAGHHRSSALRQLTRVTAQMAGLVFLTLIKLNQPVRARAWARTARIAADEAGDPATCSWVWAQEAYVHFYDGHLVEAVEVARHAQALAGRAAAVGVPLAAALEARALAVLGRRREALAGMSRADAALTRLNDDLVAPSAFGYNEAQLQFHQGNALTHLRDTEAARASQQRALDLYPSDDFLDRALVHLDQAFCMAYDGDAEAAAGCVTRALAGLTNQQRAGLVTVRARELLAALARHRTAISAAHELRDLLATETEIERTRP